MLGSAAQDGDVSEQQLEKYKKEEEEETLLFCFHLQTWRYIMHG